MDNRSGCKPIVRRKKPSFSSSLLDHIYRSIDDQTPPPAAAEDPLETGKKTEQKVNMMLFEKPVGRRKSASAEYYDNLNTNYFQQSFGLNSCSASSDSSFWTSSESETSKSVKSKLALRTSLSCQQHQDDKMYYSERKLKNECGGFVKAKSKALKMYSDLKKSKAAQPISPGIRLASFLNSLFTYTGNTKKSKSKIDKRNNISANAASACSSASSFSRSCLSETPSSRGKLTDGAKRSVRFYPVISTIMDEDCIYKDNGRPNKANIPARNSICGEEVMEKNRRARELLKNYEKRLEECKIMNDDDDDDDDDDEDCESCTSSDLFELDNLDYVSQRYCEELPVYETTSLDANRAIAHGLIV